MIALIILVVDGVSLSGPPWYVVVSWVVMDSRVTLKLLGSLKVGRQYDAYDVDRLIEKERGYTSQRGGVVTSRGENFMLLFVTLHKAKDATQYVDHLENNTLFWEGQTNQKFAERYMESGDYQIMVFLRDKPHTQYTYYGRCLPLRQYYHDPGTPSQVVFDLFEWPYVDRTVVPEEMGLAEGASDVVPLYTVPTETDATRVETVRTAQSLYRKLSLDFWHHKCAVTQIDEEKILIASHIKPWRESDNSERVDPHNSLILSPTYDKLFDLGYITFDPNDGRIVLSDLLHPSDYDRLGVKDSQRLVCVPDGTASFLQYHKTYVYNFHNERQTDNSLLVV